GGPRARCRGVGAARGASAGPGAGHAPGPRRVTAAGPTVVQLLGPSTGGIRRVVATLTAGLRGRGWEVVTAGPAGVLRGLVDQDAVVPVSPRRAAAARRALTPLFAGADLVHAHGLTAGWLAATVRHRPPLVVSV